MNTCRRFLSKSAIKAVSFNYEAEVGVEPLLETFRMMVNHAVCVGLREGIRSRFKLIGVVYNDFKRYGLHTHYTLNACEVASTILKNHKRNHRSPVARRLFLKLDNQTYKLESGNLRIPVKPRQFMILKLRLGDYQRQFLEDRTLKLGSLTLTEEKAIIAFKKQIQVSRSYQSVVAYDTNELSLDGAHSTPTGIIMIREDLRKVASIRTFHFKRRRRIQSRLAHSQRRLRGKLAADRDRERRRVDAVLHQVAKRQLDLARIENAKIVLEDLKGIKRSINRQVRKRNPYNGKLQPISVRSKTLKRRLNNWPYRRLQGFMEYKANWEGVPLTYVPARNTSRTCARCGCLRSGFRGEQDPKTRQVFQCPECGWICGRHVNAALNLLRTQDEGRWFSPDRFRNEVMTEQRAYAEEDKPPSNEDLTEPDNKHHKMGVS
jgi:putative transposase